MAVSRKATWRVGLIATVVFCVLGSQSAFGCDDKAKPPAPSAKPRKVSKGIPGGVTGCGPASIATPTRVRVGSEVSKDYLITMLEPSYPASAREYKIQGYVELQIIVDKAGMVANVRLISGERLLVTAATDAVKNWRFRPYVLNNEPVEMETSVRLKFSLSDSGEGSVNYEWEPSWNNRAKPQEPFWASTRGKVQEDLLAVYECWRPKGIGEVITTGCGAENGMVVVRVTASDDPPVFFPKIARISTDPHPENPKPNEYTFRVHLSFLPSLANLAEVTSIELVREAKSDSAESK